MEHGDLVLTKVTQTERSCKGSLSSILMLPRDTSHTLCRESSRMRLITSRELPSSGSNLVMGDLIRSDLRLTFDKRAANLGIHAVEGNLS